MRPVRFPYAANFVKRRNINKTSAFSTISSRTIPVRNRTPSRTLPYDSRTLLQRAEMTVKPMLCFNDFGFLVHSSRTIPVRYLPDVVFFISFFCYGFYFDFINFIDRFCQDSELPWRIPMIGGAAARYPWKSLKIFAARTPLANFRPVIPSNPW